MKKKVLVIGGIAAAAMLAGGWALAQTPAGPGGFGPPFMQRHGPMAAMGPGMMQHMGREWIPGMMQHGRRNGSWHDAWWAWPDVQLDPAQIETLKTELGITAAQEPAWTKYAKALQDAATAMKTAREGIDPEAVSKIEPAGALCVRDQDARARAEAVRDGEDGRERTARHARRRAEGQGPGDPPGAGVRSRVRCAEHSWAARNSGIEASSAPARLSAIHRRASKALWTRPTSRERLRQGAFRLVSGADTLCHKKCCF